MNLTHEEKVAIRELKKIARHWPDSLWLFTADGVLNVMKKNDHGQRNMITRDDILWDYDPEYIAEQIRIEADGGDW